MTPLIVSTAHVRTLIQQISRPYADPGFREVDRSENLIIPSRRYFENDWQTYWNKLRDDKLGKNNGYFCELFAYLAMVEFHLAAFQHNLANPGQDAGGGLMTANIEILDPPFMGINADKHCTNLIAYTEDGENVELAFWESQHSQCRLVPLEDALKKGIIVRCIDL